MSTSLLPAGISGTTITGPTTLKFVGLATVVSTSSVPVARSKRVLLNCGWSAGVRSARTVKISVNGVPRVAPAALFRPLCKVSWYGSAMSAPNTRLTVRAAAS